jgi:hypothetical protein
MAVGVLILFSVAGGANAYHIDIEEKAECSSKLNSVELAIKNAIFKNNWDRTRLQSKLTAAASKISDGKISDGIEKLDDISEKVMALADAKKPKLSDADRESIVKAINDAMTACLG